MEFIFQSIEITLEHVRQRRFFSRLCEWIFWRWTFCTFVSSIWFDYAKRVIMKCVIQWAKKKRKKNLELLRARNGCSCIFFLVTLHLLRFKRIFEKKRKKNTICFAFCLITTMHNCMKMKTALDRLLCTSMLNWIDRLCILFFFLRLFLRFCFKHMSIQWHLVYIQCWICMANDMLRLMYKNVHFKQTR